MGYSYHFQKLPPFTTHPGTRDCLRDLSELTCGSSLDSEFFRQVSRICHRLRSLRINLESVISDGLQDLITVQQTFKELNIINRYDRDNFSKLVPSITKLPNHLIRLHVCDGASFSLLPTLPICKSS